MRKRLGFFAAALTLALLLASSAAWAGFNATMNSSLPYGVWAKTTISLVGSNQVATVALNSNAGYLGQFTLSSMNTVLTDWDSVLGRQTITVNQANFIPAVPFVNGEVILNCQITDMYGNNHMPYNGAIALWSYPGESEE